MEFIINNSYLCKTKKYALMPIVVFVLPYRR